MKRSALLLPFICVCFAVQLDAKVELLEKGLSYDDVLLVPQRSSVQSRRSVSTNTHLSRNIELSIPLVSANMDTVTESDMAIAMAQRGGIGIIHRFNSIEEEVREVERVKRFRSNIVTDPKTIAADATVEQAKEIMKEHGISSLLVADNENKLTGILTSRDMRFRPPSNQLVSELMTPREQLVVGKVGISIKDAKKLLMEHRIEKLPIVQNDWTIAGLITGKDIYNKAEYPHAAVDKYDRLLVGAAIGVKEDSIDRAKALVAAGADVLVIDIAHVDSDLAINTIKRVKEACPSTDIIAGNVATAQGTRNLIEAGADAVKVGVGPGSICTTRITAGSGYPQFSAVLNCAREAEKYNVPVIADGGIRYSGDITKAVAAGASTVMLGSLLAGTDESPGIPFMKGGQLYKVVRGMASFGANLARKDTENKVSYVPEGVEALVKYKASVERVIQQLLGGLYSGMSYCGVHSVERLRGNGVFVEITGSGIRESHPHDVQQIV